MKKKKNTDKEIDEENEKKVTRRTLWLEARVTEQEYAQAAELAKTCGLSISEYVRRTALGQTGYVFQRYPICGTMDEDRYSAYQSLEPDRKLPY